MPPSISAVVQPGTQSGRSAISGVVARLAPLTPYLLALFFALSSLRGIPGNTAVEADAARHLMNGVFIHDWLQQPHPTHPAKFGLLYYSRLPALSLPYHPPLFPVLEALSFFVFGVNLAAARLVVALSVFLAAFLLFRVVEATHKSRLLAAAVVTVFVTLPTCQALAADVMLEFPSLVFVAAAMYCFVRFGRDGRVQSGIAFGVLAGAAVWTKQHSVLLGAVPLLYVLIARRWDLLRRRAIWICLAVFWILVLLLLALPLLIPLQKGPAIWRPDNILHAARVAALYYSRWAAQEVGSPAAILGGLGLLFAIASPARLEPARNPENTVYAAWAASAGAMLLALPLWDKRYLLYAYPPLLVIALDGLSRGARMLLRPDRARYAPALLALAWLPFHIHAATPFITGPDAAAATVLTRPCPRVLFCGRSNGPFIYSIRVRDQRGQTVVLRGDKVPPQSFGHGAFETFLRTYGVSAVVLERTGENQPWHQVFMNPPECLNPEQIIPLSSTRPELNGALYVYRVASPAEPAEKLKVKLGLDWNSPISLTY